MSEVREFLEQEMQGYRKTMSEPSGFTVQKIPFDAIAQGTIIFEKREDQPNRTVLRRTHLQGVEDILDAETAKLLQQGCVTKEYKDLHDLLPLRKQPFLRKIARNTLLRENKIFQSIPQFAYAFAYTFSPEGNLISIFEELDATLKKDAVEQYDRLDYESYAQRELAFFIEIGKGVAAFDCDKRRLWDFKPTNVCIKYATNEVKEIDLDLAGSQPKVDGQNRGDTTQLSEYGEFWGTMDYLPPELLTQMISMKDYPYNVDIFSFGVSMLEVFFPEEFNHAKRAKRGEGPFSFSERKNAFRLAEKKQEPIYVALKRIIASAMDQQRGYQEMNELLEHLRAAQEKEYEFVIRNPKNALTWEHREGELEYTRRRFMKRVIFGSLGIAGSGILAGGGYSLKKWYDYDSSVEGIARKVAKLNLEPKMLEELILAQADVEENDFDKIYSKELFANKFLFPLGTFSTTGTKFSAGESALSEHVVALLANEFSLTGRKKFLQYLLAYTEKISFDLPDLNADERATRSDFRSRSWGRFAFYLENYADLERLSHQPRVRQMSVDAATFLVSEFDKDTGALLDVKEIAGQKKDLVLYAEQLYIYAPLIFAAARSPRLKHIISPSLSRTERECQTGIEQYLEKIPDISCEEFYRRVAILGVQASRYFVRPDGKSFLRVNIDKDGKILSRNTDPYEPGYNGDENQQSVLSRSHMHVLSGILQLRNTLRESYRDERLEKELGSKHAQFISEMKISEQKMQETIDVLYDYQQVRNRAVFPKYLFLARGQQPNANLDQDLLPTMVYLRELILDKPELVRKNLVEILGTASMNTGNAKKYTPDIFLSCEGYYYGWHGSMIEASRKFTDVLKWIKKN